MPPAPPPRNESERYIALMAYRSRGLVADVHAIKLARDAKAYFGVQQAAIALVGRTTVYLLAETAFGFDSLPREHSFSTYAIHDKTPIVVEDTLLDPRFADNPYVTGAPWLRFYAAAPLIDADGYCLGTFSLVDPEPRSLTPAAIARLVDFSRRAMHLIELQKTMSALMHTYGSRSDGAATKAGSVIPTAEWHPS